MRISDIITPATIAVRVHLEDKAHALRFAAASLGARSGLDPERIREALASREALGSTGIGQGVAVPHVCFSDLDRPYALFCTLTEPIDFDSIDGKPVDLIFTIISPASSAGGESLAYLAAVSRILRDKDRAAALRNANNPWSVYDIIVKSAAAAAQLVS
ncbi:MAG: PTS sugar transporter subunit IIA [Rhodomicrobium sp.]|nr:PTS sugar transporter subunit IIA [Rhodomicrobium sp.]